MIKSFYRMLSPASRLALHGTLSLFFIVYPLIQASAADELVIRNRDGSVVKRVIKNPYTGGYDIRTPNGRRVGTIERSPITRNLEMQLPNGKRAALIEERN